MLAGITGVVLLFSGGCAFACYVWLNSLWKEIDVFGLEILVCVKESGCC